MKQAHICLDETLGVRYAILPGDPARLTAWPHSWNPCGSLRTTASSAV